MIPSQFTLDHRLSELRPTADEMRLARELEVAADSAADVHLDPRGARATRMPSSAAALRDPEPSNRSRGRLAIAAGAPE